MPGVCSHTFYVACLLDICQLTPATVSFIVLPFEPPQIREAKSRRPYNLNLGEEVLSDEFECSSGI